jgi:hypothetical protein
VLVSRLYLFCPSFASFASSFVAEETTHSLRFVTPNTVGAICIHIYDWVILRHFVPSLLHSNFVASIPFLLSSLVLSVFLCAVCSDFCCLFFIVIRVWYLRTVMVLPNRCCVRNSMIFVLGRGGSFFFTCVKK